MIFLLLLLTDQEQSFADDLYRVYKAPMWHFALSLCHDPAAADDVIQAAFLALLGKLDILEQLDRHQRKAYIAVTVKRLAYRQNAPKREMALEWADNLPGGDSVELLIDKRADMDMLRQAVHKLPDDDKEIITLHYGLGFNSKEVAKLLDIRPGTARMRSHRAIQRLRFLMIGGDVVERKQSRRA